MGTQRADGGWWHDVLRRHPQIGGPGALDFFTPFWARDLTGDDIARYHAHFDGGEVCGEWTPRYLHDPWTAPLLARAAPDAKVLVLLADPIERYRQRVGWVRKQGALEDPEYHVADGMSDVVAQGRYATQLRRLWRVVDPDRTLVLQHERCLADLRRELARTLRFLGVRDDHVPRRTGPAPRARLAQWRVLRAAREVELWPDIEAALRAELAPEMQELRSLVPDLDLGLWRSLDAVVQ
jgi:hypothetical protein